MKSALMTLASIFGLPNLIIGDEVLDHMSCEYSDIKQRNFKRDASFLPSLINSAIIHNIIGGNIVLYKLLSGIILVLDGRSRLLKLKQALTNQVTINLNNLIFGAMEWPITEGVTLAERSNYFCDYPTHIQNKVKNIEFQVHMLNEKTCTLDKARDLFVQLNYGLKKMNKDQINKNIFFGDMTNLTYELTMNSTITPFIKQSDIESDAGNGFVNYIVNQTLTGALLNETGIKHMLKSYKSLSKHETQKIISNINEIGTWLEKTVAKDNSVFMQPANIVVLSYVLWRFKELGININNNITNIKTGITKLTKNIIILNESKRTNGKSKAITNKQILDLRSWDTNGSALRSSSAKIIRAEKICDYIVSEFTTSDKDKVPREFAK